MNEIKTLSKQLESLQITKEASNEYEQTDTEMLAAPALATNENIQAIMPKSMVPDLEWFNGDQKKFEDWWKGIQLYFKSNKAMETDNKITVILAHLRGGVAGIYV